MKRALLVCALLLICSAAPPSFTKITCGEYIGHGTRVGPHTVVTALHVVQDKRKSWPLKVDKREASIAARGAKHVRSLTPADDGCDWAVLRVQALNSDPVIETARAKVGGKYWYWGYNQRHDIEVVNVGDNVASFIGCYVREGESGTGVFDDDGRLVGIITSGVEPCTGNDCPLPGPDNPQGWFCMISPELRFAIDKARGE